MISGSFPQLAVDNFQVVELGEDTYAALERRSLTSKRQIARTLNFETADVSSCLNGRKFDSRHEHSHKYNICTTILNIDALLLNTL